MHVFVVWSAEPDFNQANYRSASWRATTVTGTSARKFSLARSSLSLAGHHFYPGKKNSIFFAKILHLHLEICAGEDNERKHGQWDFLSNDLVDHSLTKRQVKLLKSPETEKSMQDDPLV